MNKMNIPVILVVEDEESNYLYMKAVLSKLNANIMWAHNGIEAVRICDSESPIDLILMDLQMPEMNGYEATPIIKEKHPQIPIIAQTAYAMSNDREKALNAGCDNYLSKPIKSKDLITMIQNYLIL